MLSSLPYILLAVSISNIEDIVNGDYDLGIGYTIMLIAGGVIAISVVVVVVIYAKKELRKLLEEDQARELSKE